MLDLLLVLIAVAGCLCSNLTIEADDRRLLVLNHSNTSSYRVAVKSVRLQHPILNIQWYPLDSVRDLENRKAFPRIELHRVASQTKTDDEKPLTSESLYFEFVPSVQDMVDESFLPVRLLGESDFILELQGAFAFSLQVSAGTNATVQPNADLVAVLGPNDDRFEFFVDRKVGKQDGEKFCLFVYFGQGEELFTEATYDLKQPGTEKIRKTEVSNRNLSSVYLMPFEIKDLMTRVNLMIVRKESSPRSEVIMKVRLAKLHWKSQVNLVSLYQALENVDYPLGTSLRLVDTPHHQRSIDFSDQTYFLNASGLQNASNYLVSMMYVHGADLVATSFRRLTGFDRALLDCKLLSSRLFFEAPLSSKAIIKERSLINITSFESNINISNGVSFFKKVLIKDSFEKHVLDSGDIYGQRAAADSNLNLLLVPLILICTAALTVGLVLLLFSSKIKDKKAADPKQAMRQRVDDLDEMKKIVSDFEAKSGVELVNERHRPHRPSTERKLHN